jgi:hypothetical protein
VAQVLLVIILVALWGAAMWAGFLFVFPVVFPLTLVGTVAAVIGEYTLQASRVLVSARANGPSRAEPPAEESGKDPAYRHYLLAQVWLDWRAIAEATVPRVYRSAEKVVLDTTRLMMRGWWGFFALPLWLAICGGIVLAAIPVAVLAVVVALLYAVVAALGLAGWLVCVGVLGAIERVFMAYGRVLQTCPHPSCYEKIALPIYACPTCDRWHRRLTPGGAGAFRHVCRCGARLPTTIPLGRYRLTAYCPHCQRRLPERIGRVRVEPIPFVGGPAAGKTTFMFLAIRALHARSRGMGGRVAFVERRHQQAYAGAVAEFQRGGQLAKTGPGLPLATMVDVELPGSGRRILYLFDPAGEQFAGAAQVESLRYLDHGEALLFIVDPFALPEVRRSLTADEDVFAVQSADEDPADTLQRVLNELRARPDKGRQKRVAVVVTKADLLARTAVGKGLRRDGSVLVADGPEDDPVRSWLEGLGLGNTTRTLDQLAAQVRYFCSGLDTEPAAVSDLMGWVTGLHLNGHHADDDLAPTGELPGTSPLRAPWNPVGREAGLVPRGYQFGRWAILVGMTLLEVACVGAALWYAIRWFR